MLFTPKNTNSSHSSRSSEDSFFKSRVQTKLAVGQPGDRYEVEADNTADKVVSRLKEPKPSGVEKPAFFSPKPVVQTKRKETIQQKEEAGQEQEIQENLPAEQARPLSESITPLVQTSLLSEEPVQEKCDNCEEEKQPQPVQAKCAECEAKEKEAEAKGEIPVQTKCDKCEEKALTVQQKKGALELPVVPDALGKKKEEEVAAGEEKASAEGETKAPEGGADKKGEEQKTGGEKGAVDLPMLAGEKPKSEEEPAMEPIQQKEAGKTSGTSGVSEKLSASKGKGSPMSASTQSDMNSGFGSDFSNVRIHTDSTAVQMNKELGSQAFTNGSDIYFNEGKYNPESDSGKHLLAHELTHTVQQGATSNTVQRFVGPPKTVTPEPSPEKPNDGDVMTGNANSRYENDENVKNQDDLDEDEAKEKKDPPRDEIRSENSQVKAEGVTQPPVDRGGQAAAKIDTQKQQMNEKLAEPPPKGEGKPEKKDAKGGKAPATAEQGKAKAKAASAQAAAQAVPIPATPQPFKHPNVEAPVDSAGEPLPRQANIDTQVRGLGYIGEMLRTKGYELKEAAAQKTAHAHGLDSVIGKQMEDLANAREGTQKIDDNNTSRKDISKTSKQVLDDSKQRQAFVAAEAPGLAGEAEGGKADSGGLASEASSKASQAKGETPDDPDAQADAAKQNAEMDQTAEGAKSMDDAVTQTGERAKQYIADAEVASKDNQQSESQIQETDGIVAQVDARVAEMKAKNEESNTKIQAVEAGPEGMRQEAVRTAETGDELISATIYMETELNALQDEYLASMKTIESREQAEERIKKEQENQPPPSLSPEDEQLFALAAMPEQEQQAAIQQLTPKQRDGLLGALDKMSKQMPDNGTDATEGERKEVKLGSLVPEGPQDPRQEQITAVDNQRVARLSGVLDVADVNMNYLSEEQQMMLAEKLVAESLTDDVKNISILQIGKGMIEGMLDPRMALQGVVDGFGKTLTGVANLFNADAWAKDPLGNLLQVGADISTGLAQIFSSILGVAGMITALMVAIIIISWGFATPVCAPVIGWMGTVMTYAGWGAIIAGSLSVLFNSLAYIKNLNDAGTAKSARELFGNTEQMKQNATDGLTGAMSIVEGVGAVKMGPVMKSGNFINNIPKSPGALFKQTMEGAKDGLGAIKSIPGNVVKGAKKLFASGKKGLLELKDKIKRFFKGAPDVDGPHGSTPHTKTPDIDAPLTNAPDKTPHKTASDGTTLDAGSPETPKSRTTKADGKPLDDFQGQKVNKEAEFNDGHKGKVLDDGQCAICTDCKKIRSKFKEELDAAPETKAKLKEYEDRLKADKNDIEALDGQKKIHDEMQQDSVKRTSKRNEELEKKIKDRTATKEEYAEYSRNKRIQDDNVASIRQRYEDANPSVKKTREAKRKKGLSEKEVQQSAGLTDEEIIKKIQGGQQLNEETGLFKNTDNSKEIDHHAQVSKEEFELGDKKSNPNADGEHEIKVNHNELPEKKRRKLKTAEENRKRAKATKEKIQEDFDKNGGVIDGVKYDRIEDVPKWKEAHGKMIKASEQLGEISTDAVMNKTLPGAKKLQSRPAGKHPDAKSAEFDSIYEHNGDIYVVESKGAGADRGSRKIEDGTRAEQGSVPYRDDVIKVLEKQALEAGDTELLKTVMKMKNAIKANPPKLKYLQVTQRVDGAGNIVPHANVINFNQ